MYTEVSDGCIGRDGELQVRGASQIVVLYILYPAVIAHCIVY